MNHKFLFIAIILTLVSCTSNTKTTEEENQQETSAALSNGPDSKVASVMNPNLASKDELLKIPQLDEEKANQIIEARPFLKSSDFITMIKGFLPEEVVSDISVSLFLPMNLNTTEEKDFLLVPGVGEKMAHEFEEYRPYKSIQQFRREIGKYVDDEQVSTYEQYVFVPVNLNTGSKEEILAIPGVGEKMLHEFEEYRPYKSIEQFRREIGKYVDDDELVRLERYVTLD